ncbi:TetR/AcrR family transcriptional regulator [Mesorhizobium sp. A556]
MAPNDDLAERIIQAFLDVGYEQATMSGLARACGFTRRALYHHFSNKEEAFRHTLRVGNERAIGKGMAAGRIVLERGGSAVEVLSVIMDARYGDTRRRLAASPHALEINEQAFRRGGDIMMEWATAFQRQLAEILVELQASGLLRLKQQTTIEDLAQTLADGARGVNQARPPIAPEKLPERYRRMCEAILYGCADPLP